MPSGTAGTASGGAPAGCRDSAPAAEAESEEVATGAAAPDTTRWGVAAFLRCARLLPMGEAAPRAGELAGVLWLRACCILVGLAWLPSSACCSLAGDFWGFRLLGDRVVCPGRPGTMGCPVLPGCRKGGRGSGAQLMGAEMA